MIRLDNVSYSYEKGGGVSNVNLSLGDDEYAFLIGPTGSGKTTLPVSYTHLTLPTTPYV